MWKATLKSIPEVTTPTDYFEIQVEYMNSEDESRKFTKSVKLTAGNITTLQDVKNIVASEIQALEKLDSVKSILQSSLNEEI